MSLKKLKKYWNSSSQKNREKSENVNFWPKVDTFLRFFIYSSLTLEGGVGGGGGGEEVKFELDLGTTWSNPNRLATPLIPISFSSPSGGEVGVGLLWV